MNKLFAVLYGVWGLMLVSRFALAAWELIELTEWDIGHAMFGAGMFLLHEAIEMLFDT